MICSLDGWMYVTQSEESSFRQIVTDDTSPFNIDLRCWCWWFKLLPPFLIFRGPKNKKGRENLKKVKKLKKRSSETSLPSLHSLPLPLNRSDRARRLLLGQPIGGASAVLGSAHGSRALTSVRPLANSLQTSIVSLWTLWLRRNAVTGLRSSLKPDKSVGPLLKLLWPP